MQTSQITIDSLHPEETGTAIGVLARAFVTNPLHEAAFGPSRLDSNEEFFRVGLDAMKGAKLVARDGTRILGVAHWVRSPDCQFSGLEKLRMMPRVIRGLGVRTAIDVMSWLSAWSKHDLTRPHVHLGPIAVEPEAQGRHVGSKLMKTYCEELDLTGMAGFLETDRSANVRFYERFGFVVTETAFVLGVNNYFMRRGQAQ